MANARKWKKRWIQVETAKAFTLGGGNVTFNLSQNITDLVCQIKFKVKAVLSTGATTLTADGANAIFGNVQVAGRRNKSDWNPVPGLSGGDLAHLYLLKRKQLPRTIGDWTQAGLKKQEVSIDLMQLSFGEALSHISCWDMWNIQNAIITLTPGAIADVAATGTIATSTLEVECWVQVVEQKNVFDTLNLTYPDGSKKSFYLFHPTSLTLVAIGVNDINAVAQAKNIFLSLGGKVTYILMRAFSATGVSQVDTTSDATSAPFDTTTGKEIKILGLSTAIQDESTYQNIRDEVNTYLNGPSIPSGVVAFLPASHGTSGLIDTDELQAQGAQALTIKADLRQPSAGGGIRFIQESILDPNGDLN